MTRIARMGGCRRDGLRRLVRSVFSVLSVVLFLWPGPNQIFKEQGPPGEPDVADFNPDHSTLVYLRQ